MESAITRTTPCSTSQVQSGVGWGVIAVMDPKWQQIDYSIGWCKVHNLTTILNEWNVTLSSSRTACVGAHMSVQAKRSHLCGITWSWNFLLNTAITWLQQLYKHVRRGHLSLFLPLALPLFFLWVSLPDVFTIYIMLRQCPFLWDLWCSASWAGARFPGMLGSLTP